LIALAIAATTISGALAPMDAHASDRVAATRTQRYLVGDAGPMRDPLGQALTSPSCGIVTLGSLCFGATVGDTFTVEVTDDSGRDVGGIVILSTRGGRTVAHPFCGTTGSLPAVRGDLAVHLDAPGDVRGAHWFGGPGCAEINPLGGTTGATTLGATSGSVQVTFTTRD
jgi:hypothetical protein